MASVVGRRAHPCRSSFRAVDRVWSSVGRPLSPSELQHRSYFDEGIDGRVPPSSPAGDPLSRKFSSAVPKTQTFGAQRPVYGRSSYPRTKREGIRVRTQYRSYSDEGIDGRVPPSAPSADPLSRQFSPAVLRTPTFGAQRPVYGRNASARSERGGFRVYRPIIKLRTQYRSYSDEGVDGRVPASPPAADPLSRQFQPAVLITQTFGAQRPVYGRNAYARSKLEGFMVYRPIIKLRTQYRSYSDEGVDGRVPASPPAAHLLSRQFSPAVLKTQTLGAQRLVYERNGYPLSKREGFRVYRPIKKLSRTALSEGERPVRSIRESRNVAQESRHDFPRQGFASGKELRIGSACGRDNLHLSNATTTSEAISILKHRQQQGLSVDSYMFVEILKRCSMQKDLIATRQVHEYIIQSGMQKHQYVATTLLNVYIKCGRLQDARRVFDGLERNNRTVITWNVMIGAYAKCGFGTEAYGLFLQMKQEGFEPNANSYVSILNASASAGALEWVKEVHSHARKAGLESNLRVGSALVHMYAKSGSIHNARLVFDRMERRDVITWNTMIGAYAGSGSIEKARVSFDRMEKRDIITWNVMIGAYAESGYGVEAYRLFLQMKREGFIPDAFTYSSILNASASAGALEWVKEVHSHAREAGLESDLRVGSALVHMYAKSGSINDARLVFDRMKKRDVITWNIMIRAYAENGSIDDARLVFDRMQRRDVITWNIMIGAYAEYGSIDDARLLFDRMEKRDVITWNVMIGAYAESGCGVEAYRLFLQMKREGFTPDAFTYVSILNPSASTGALEWVKDVHGHARSAGLESELRVGTALVHMYAKCGSIDEARLVFDRMKERDVVTWTAMIGGLALHGRGDEALKLFEKMIADDVKPNGSLFVGVLSACCHAGLVDDGRRLFLAMKQDYGIEPTVVHYSCMVDLLGRAGHLEEAKLLIDKMPVEPNAVTWKALLAACRTYSNVELGEFAAKEVLKLEPKDDAAYVLLSNIYAAAGKWEKVSSVRTVMQERGVRKEPGRSWIEVDNKIHEFFVGDKSHPEARAIYSELKNLSEQLKAKGYIPDTKLVLRNVDEEEKELALCSHSEKLAIAYGLLRVPRGKPIRVEKNLRVCSDCHTATKLISEVTGREIIVRDANRFHHFKDGVCSCGDYW